MAESAHSETERLEGLPSAREIIREIADDPEVDSRVRAADVVEEYEELVDVHAGPTMTAVEDIDTRWLPASTYEAKLRSAVPYDERYEAAPTDITTKDVGVIETGQPVVTCPRCDGTERHDCETCGGTQTTDCTGCSRTGSKTCPQCDGDPRSDCPDCGGTGNDDCDACHGTGTQTIENATSCTGCGGSGEAPCPVCVTGDGDPTDCERCDGEQIVECTVCGGNGKEGKTEPCPDCAGGGTRDCSNCGGDGQIVTCDECRGRGRVDCEECGGDGTQPCTVCDNNGKVTCTRCEGDGEAVQAKTGALSFTVETESEVESKFVPKRLIHEGDGEVVESSREAPKERAGVYRRQRDRSVAPVKYVKYRYNDRAYEAAHVDGTLRYPDYPRDPGSIEETIQGALDRDRFTRDPDRSLSETLRAAPGRFARDAAEIVGGVLIGVVALLVLGFILYLLPIGSAAEDAAGIAGMALVTTGYAWGIWTLHDGEEIESAANGGGLFLPLVVGAGAIGVVLTGALSTSGQLLFATGAATLLAVRVGHRLGYERIRTVYRSTARGKFISYELDGRGWELEDHGLNDALPPKDPRPGTETLRVASAVVYALGLGLGSAYFGVLLLASVLSDFTLLEYLGVTQAFVLPGVLALLGIGGLALIVIGKAANS